MPIGALVKETERRTELLRGMLNALRGDPAALNQIAEVARGRILKASPRKKRRIPPAAAAQPGKCAMDHGKPRLTVTIAAFPPVPPWHLSRLRRMSTIPSDEVGRSTTSASGVTRHTRRSRWPKTGPCISCGTTSMSWVPAPSTRWSWPRCGPNIPRRSRRRAWA